MIDIHRAAESDIVHTEKTRQACSEKTGGLVGEISVEGSAADGFHGHIADDRSFFFIRDAKVRIGPFPDIADKLKNTIGGGTAFKFVDGNGMPQAGGPDVASCGVQGIAPGISSQNLC